MKPTLAQLIDRHALHIWKGILEAVSVNGSKPVLCLIKEHLRRFHRQARPANRRPRRTFPPF